MSKHIKESREELLKSELKKARAWAIQQGLVSEGTLFKADTLVKWPPYKELKPRQQEMLKNHLEKLNMNTVFDKLW